MRQILNAALSNLFSLISKLVQESVINIKSKLEEMTEVYKEKAKSEDEDFKSNLDLINTNLILFIFFEYFIVFKDDNLHLLNIRSEIVRHCLSGDLSQLDIMADGKIYIEIYHINALFQKIISSIKISDFEKLSELCKIVADDFALNKFEDFSECFLDIKTIFINLSRIFEGYSKLLSNTFNITERNKNELIRSNRNKM